MAHFHTDELYYLPKTSWLHLRLPRHNRVPHSCGRSGVDSKNCFKAILYLNSGALVLHWSLEWTLSRTNPLLLWLWKSRLSSPSLSSCCMGTDLPGKQRGHLRKDTCVTSENLASRDTGSAISVRRLCLELDWKTSRAEKLSPRSRFEG